MIRLGIWSEQSVNPLGARPYNTALPVKPPVAAKPILLGVLCRVAWRTDPQVCIGVHVSDVACLPVVEVLDPVVTQDWTLSRLSDDEPRPSSVHFFPRAFTTEVLKLVPRTGPTTPIDPSDPDYAAALVAATEAIERDGVRNPGPPSIFNPSDFLFDRIAELAVRSYALPIDVAAPLVQPFSPFDADTTRARLEALQKDGITRPRYEAQAVIDEAARERSRLAAAERARKQNDAHLTVKRPRHLLVIKRTARASTDKIELEGLGLMPRDQEPLIGDAYRELHGLPGVIGEEVQRPGISIAMATVDLTDAEYNTTVGVVSDKLLAEIHAQRVAAHPQTYSEKDFEAADSRTVEGRYALEQFKAKAHQLIAAGNGSREWTYYADACLFSLPIAFGGKVGLQQACDVITEALGGLNAGSGTVIAHGSGAVGYKLEASPRSLYAGRIPAETVPARLLEAISRSGPWAWGELLPTVQTIPAPDAARLARMLDKDLFRKAVTDGCDGKDEVRVEDVYHSLFTSGAIDSETPNAEQKKRTTAILESLGFHGVTRGGGKKGPRYRCWVRELSEEDKAPGAPATAPPPDPCPPFVRPIVDDADAPAYVAPVYQGQVYPDGVVVPAAIDPGAPVPTPVVANFVRPMVDEHGGAKPYVPPVNHGPQYPPGFVRGG
jgi:hypothetical protein